MPLPLQHQWSCGPLLSTFLKRMCAVPAGEASMYDICLLRPVIAAVLKCQYGISLFQECKDWQGPLEHWCWSARGFNR